MKRFRGGPEFKAHTLLYHSTLGLRVLIKKKKKHRQREEEEKEEATEARYRGTSPIRKRPNPGTTLGHLGIDLRQGPGRVRFVISEVTLYLY